MNKPIVIGYKYIIKHLSVSAYLRETTLWRAYSYALALMSNIKNVIRVRVIPIQLLNVTL